MEWVQLIISIGVSLGLIFLSYYVVQKAKDFAQIEDMAKITELVEEVKSTFAKEIAVLNANLNVLTNTQLSLVNEERNAIVDFAKKYFMWFNTISAVPSNYDYTNLTS